MEDQTQQPESLLPYEKWTENALRQVVAQAIEHVAVNGLPGGHHFYITFRTDYPGTEVPPRLKAQYPHEMTIVLQHQFWDLGFDRETNTITVGLSFGGVGSKLIIPLNAVLGFADPHIHFDIRFPTTEPPVFDEPAEPEPSPAEETAAETKESEPQGQVVSLDAFRRRTT